jgi:hypothetical protein
MDNNTVFTPKQEQKPIVECAFCGKTLTPDDFHDTCGKQEPVEPKPGHEVTKLREALIWCSGSTDFQEGGQARKGWLNLCAPLLNNFPAPQEMEPYIKDVGIFTQWAQEQRQEFTNKPMVFVIDWLGWRQKGDGK